MGACFRNDLLEQIQKKYPKDTVDDILDWAEVARDHSQNPVLTVSAYGKWRNDSNQNHHLTFQKQNLIFK
jgi:hypothetical protein